MDAVSRANKKGLCANASTSIAISAERYGITHAIARISRNGRLNLKSKELDRLMINGSL